MKVVVLARAPRWYGFKKDGTCLRILAEGHDIEAVVVETTSTASSLLEWRRKLGLRLVLSKIGDRLLPRARNRTESGDAQPPSSTGPDRCDSPVIRVISHNSDECIRAIESLAPDILVLRGCGILRGPILGTAKTGVINAHYAILPEYRGMDVTEWSMLHGTPCAVSVHWVTTGVDDGEVILAEHISTENAASLGELRERCAALSRELMARALTLIDTRSLTPTRMKTLTGHQYFTMHRRLYQLAEERLRCTG